MTDADYTDDIALLANIYLYMVPLEVYLLVE